MPTTKNPKTKWIIPFVLIVASFCSLTRAKIIYVDNDAPGANEGASWADAYLCLQNALAVARSGDELRVAQGIHRPDQQFVIVPRTGPQVVSSGDRTATFQLRDGVAIRGGYAGFGEPDPDARDVRLYETILSGDLKGDDGPGFANNAENSYHVVTGGGTDATAVLDGFTVTGGNANDTYGYGGGMQNRLCMPMVTNCTFIGNCATRGGGMANREYSNPELTNCVFSGNQADGGGGMCNWTYSSATLTNCAFSGNTAGDGGAILVTKNSTLTLMNCTLTRNQDAAGAISCSGNCSATLANTILWDNSPNEIDLQESSVIVTYSDVRGAGRPWPGKGNINADPLFADADGADDLIGTSDDDLRLLPGSPCIDAGDNSAVPAEVVTDVRGNPRIANGIVDMGAYEFSPESDRPDAQALNPTPADGATHAYTWANLRWRAGDFAVSHNVYFGENPDDVNDGTEGTFRGNRAETFFVVGLSGYPYPNGLVPDTTYYWRIDEVNDLHPDSPWKGDVWSFSIPSKTAHTPEHFEITYYDNHNYDTDQWDAWQSDATPRDAWDDKYLADGSSGNTVCTDHAFTSISVFDLRGGFFSKDGHATGGEDWNPLRSIGDNVSEQSAHHVFAALFKGLIYLEEGDVLWVASDDDVYIFLDDNTKWGQEVLSVPYISNFSTDSMTVTAAQAGYRVMTVKYIERRDYHSGIEITLNGEHLQSAVIGAATNLGSMVNSAYWEASPSISADGLTLFFDSDRPAGSGGRDLYVAKRATKDSDWGRPVNVGEPVNTPFYDGQPGISADGRTLYFSSDRPGGFGNQDLWVTTRPTTNDGWSTPVNLGATVNSSGHDTEPSISTEGLTLFFDSDRAGGYGSWDIWTVTRASTDGRWRMPVPLPPPVNSAFSDGEPSISADGHTLYFCSNRPGGYGTFDLWVAPRETTDDQWGTPVNLGPIVNTTYHDWGPSISADGSTLYFTAEHVRNLRQNDYDLWQVSLEVSGFKGFETGDFGRLPQSSYGDESWDFVGETANGTEDIWWISEGKDYPRLWWETPSN